MPRLSWVKKSVRRRHSACCTTDQGTPQRLRNVCCGSASSSEALRARHRIPATREGGSRALDIICSGLPNYQRNPDTRQHQHVPHSCHSLENSVDASNLQRGSCGLSQHSKGWKFIWGVPLVKSAWMYLPSSCPLLSLNRGNDQLIRWKKTHRLLFAYWGTCWKLENL